MNIDLESEPEPPVAYVPAKVDETRDLDIGPLDIVLIVLTLPLVFWVLMWAVTGAEHVVATRSARYRLYAILLVVEFAIAAAIAWWVTR